MRQGGGYFLHSIETTLLHQSSCKTSSTKRCLLRTNGFPHLCSIPINNDIAVQLCFRATLVNKICYRVHGLRLKDIHLIFKSEIVMNPLFIQSVDRISWSLWYQMWNYRGISFTKAVSDIFRKVEPLIIKRISSSREDDVILMQE